LLLGCRRVRRRHVDPAVLASRPRHEPRRRAPAPRARAGRGRGAPAHEHPSRLARRPQARPLPPARPVARGARDRTARADRRAAPGGAGNRWPARVSGALGARPSPRLPRHHPGPARALPAFLPVARALGAELAPSRAARPRVTMGAPAPAPAASRALAGGGRFALLGARLTTAAALLRGERVRIRRP